MNQCSMCPKATNNDLCEQCHEAMECDISGDPDDTFREIIHWQWCEILHGNPYDKDLRDYVKNYLHTKLDTKFDSNANWTYIFKEIATQFVLDAGQVAWNQEKNSWGEASKKHLSNMALFYANCICEQDSKAIRASHQLLVLANYIYSKPI